MGTRAKIRIVNEGKYLCAKYFNMDGHVENWAPTLIAALNQTTPSVMTDQTNFIGPTQFVPAEIVYRADDDPFLILENGNPVGYLVVTIREFAELTCPYIQQLFIDRHHQGRGIGKGAMKQVIGRLRKNANNREVRISTSPENTVALGLYEALGFVRDGQINEHMKRVATGVEVLLRLQLLSTQI